MHSILHVLLWWAAFCGLALSVIMAPHTIENSGVKPWRRVVYCLILGPTVWAVVAIACLMATGMFLISANRLRRAKKANKPA